MWFLCTTYQKLPDDPWLEEMDPLTRMFLYYSWMQDLEDKHEFEHNYAVLTGSFSNPQMAKKMMNSKTQTIETSDEDFDKLSQQILEEGKKTSKKRKPRRLIKK